MSLARALGIVAIVIGVAALFMGALVLLVPEPSVGLAVGFGAVGVPLTVLGTWMAVTERPRGLDRGAGQGTGERRPKSRLRQILDGLSFHN
jgi:hypothetical protein